MHIGNRWESQKERDHWEDQDVDSGSIRKDLREIGWNGMVWNGLIWLRIGTIGRLL
jgi:hypothetical protein